MMHLFRKLEASEEAEDKEACARLDAAMSDFATVISEADVVHVAPAPTKYLSNAADLIGDVVERTKTELDRIDLEISNRSEEHARHIGRLEEERRQCVSIINRCHPAVEGMVEDFHADQPVVAISSKRKRGDKHYSKPALVTQAAE